MYFVAFELSNCTANNAHKAILEQAYLISCLENVKLRSVTNKGR